MPAVGEVYGACASMEAECVVVLTFWYGVDVVTVRLFCTL